MSKSIIAEGKTTNEAVENGLKELKVSKWLSPLKTIKYKFFDKIFKKCDRK